MRLTLQRTKEEKEDNDEVSPTETASDGAENEGSWLDEDTTEGQLAVDVYETKDSIVIVSAIAGVEPCDIDVSVNRDLVTIRGKRRQSDGGGTHDYLFQECYWGNFSRTIILPIEVRSERAKATIKNGILTVTLPKAGRTGVQTIPVEPVE